MKHPFIASRLRLPAVALLAALVGADPALAQDRTFLDAATLMSSAPAGEPGNTLAVTVAEETYAALSSTQSVSLFNLPVSPALTVDLELDRFWAWGPGTRFVVGTDRGDVPLAAPPVVFFRGTVIGKPDSKVFLSASPSGLNGIVRVDRAQYFLSAGLPGANQPRRLHWLFDGLSPEAATPPVAFECEDVLPPGHQPPIAIGVPGASDFAVSRVALVALDADFEFRQLFSTPGDALLYTCELIAAVSFFYETDVDLKLAASYIRIWDTPADPYNAPDTETQLPQFRDYWESNMGSVPRNVAHLLSARALGGGRAYRDQMCGGSSAYGVNGSLSGSFPQPPQIGHTTWDLVVLAHELGHNFSSPHTHCYSPPIDLCYTSESGCATGTPVCQLGTIMSYCHACQGGQGMAAIDLTFGPIVSNHIRSNLILCIGPARNPCFVNGAFTGTQQGTSTNPHKTVARGTWYVTPGGTVSIAAGNYPEPMTIVQPMTLTATGGLVRIGQ